MLVVEQLKSKNELNIEELKLLVRKKLKLPNNKDINYLEIKRKSLDARKELFYIYNVLIEIDNEEKYLKFDNVSKYIKENIYSYYDSKGEKCIEETVFERNANPKELLDILKEGKNE